MIRTDHELRCYGCGAGLQAFSLPLSRLDRCPDCGRALHACRMCRFYAPRVAQSCTEDDAPEVRDKEGPNFCDYFVPTADAYLADAGQAARSAAAAFEALFGGTEGSVPASPGSDPLAAAKALFGTDSKD